MELRPAPRLAADTPDIREIDSRWALSDLIRYASDLGLDSARFSDHIRKRAGAARIAEDVDSADLSGVSGTPTFFINGRRHYGSYDITALTAAVRAAKAAAATPARRSARDVREEWSPRAPAGTADADPATLGAWLADT